MFKPQLPQQEQGFTLVEVLIAILITTIFVTIAMQAMVIAAVFKARAKQFSEATTWIQQDIENVKFQAGQLKYTQLTADTSGIKVLPVSSVTGFANGDTLRVGTNTTDYTISSIDPSASTITINTALSGTQLNGATVVATNPCKATSSTAGFGQSLKQHLSTVPVPSDTSNSGTPDSGTRTITGKSYTLTRSRDIGGTEAVSGTCTSNACYELLKLTYEVKQGSESPIATMYTEVLPNAALQCPQQ